MQERPFSIHFLNLESATAYDELKTGDSTLLFFPHGENMLIDCGISEIAPVIIKKLHDFNITAIDNLVITHLHRDHVGGAAAILDAFPVQKIYCLPIDYFASEIIPSVPPFKEALDRHHMTVVPLWEGMELDFGPVHCNVLNPPHDFPSNRKDYDRYLAKMNLVTPYDGYVQPTAMLLNDSSITLRFTYEAGSFLIAGDLYYTAEAYIIKHHRSELKSVLAKVNHHGAYTSNTPQWIEAVGARSAVASRDSDPPIPAPELLAYWRFYVPEEPYISYPAHGTDFYLTHWNGTVDAILEKEGTLEITCEKGIKNSKPSDR